MCALNFIFWPQTHPPPSATHNNNQTLYHTQTASYAKPSNTHPPPHPQPRPRHPRHHQPTALVASAPPPQPAVIDPSRKWLSNVASSLQHLTGRRTTTTVRSKGPASSSSDVAGVAKPATSNNSSACVCGFLDVRPVYSLPCSHRICRLCLLTLKAANSLSCRWCQLPFGIHQPVLQHHNQ